MSSIAPTAKTSMGGVGMAPKRPAEASNSSSTVMPPRLKDLLRSSAPKPAPKDATMAASPTQSGVGRFVWYSAVAWICTRDLSTTRKLHKEVVGSTKSLQEASTRLDEVLSQMHPLCCSRSAAEEALQKALVGSVVQATARRPSERIDVNVLVSAERIAADWHDTLRDIDGTRYFGVRLDDRQIIARWPQVELWRSGSRWNLHETVYWVRYASHRGYDPKASLREAKDARAELRVALEAGKVTCWAAVCENAPGIADDERSERKRAASFWVGHSFVDVVNPHFDAAAVRKQWPSTLCAIVSGCGRCEANKRFVAAGYSVREAAVLVAKCEVPKKVRQSMISQAPVKS